MPYIRIHPVGKVSVEKSVKNEEMLELMQGEVGGYIETVYGLRSELAELVPNLMMIVNEEGVILSLRYNALASLLAPGQILFGIALLMKTAVVNEDGEEDIVPLTDEEAQRIMEWFAKGGVENA